jgi:hypothetical protein
MIYWAMQCSPVANDKGRYHLSRLGSVSGQRELAASQVILGPEKDGAHSVAKVFCLLR